MQDRPTALEILDTVAGYLENELLPALDGPLAYRTRVAANLVRILEREQALGPAALARERALLCELLQIGAANPAATPAADDVERLHARVAAAIAAGEIGHDTAWSPLMEITRAKLAIIRPGYESFDAREELP